jgi:hypothetical protein
MVGVVVVVVVVVVAAAAVGKNLLLKYRVCLCYNC